ncbi:MAG TPA: acyltransferase [Chitinophagaceae bacterium]|nr:acyltransferase [Chitinophagaceae bacterium]
MKRIPELDGLRGIAILLVVSFHYISNQLTGRTDPVSRVLQKATGFGWVGVDLFFILSGFLIGNILIANKHSSNYFKTFYIRRLVRIVPNYFLLLVVFLVIWNTAYFSNNYFITSHNVIPAWSYFLMVHNFFMAAAHSLGNDALSITWSIGIEEQFYLFFPFIVYFAGRKYLPWILALLVAAAIVFRAQFDHWIPRYVLLPSRMDGLSLGFMVAFLYHYDLLQPYKRTLVRLLPVAAGVVVLICGLLYARYGDLGVAKHTLFALIFSIALVMALLAPSSWYGAFLRNTMLTWIGVISYSLYLFHYLVLGICHHVTGQDNIGIQNRWDILVTIVAFAISLLLSWGIYNTLEKPMVRLGKRFRY